MEHSDQGLSYEIFMRVAKYEGQRIDCCYIPTRDPGGLDQLTHQLLNKYCDQVVLLPPASMQEAHVDGPLIARVDGEFQAWFSALEQLRLLPQHHSVHRWQLPLKRSYALFRSVQLGHRRIMLLDDDIRFEKEDVLRNAIALLDAFDCVSCPAVDFPDMSSIDHISSDLGKPESVFLSGACMLLNIKSPPAQFFPQIYNEDWLFLLSVPKNRIACGGVTKQKPYDPFTNHRVTFQERGDLVAPACVLFGRGDPQALSSRGFWRDRIRERHSHLAALGELASSQDKTHLRDLLRLAEKELETVNEDWCANLVASLARDQQSWLRLLEAHG